MAVRIRFLPSLKHIAAVKIAVAVYYSSRTDVLIHELQELEEMCEEFNCFIHLPRVQEKWSIIERKIQKQIRLPSKLLRKVVGALRPIHSEVKKWKEDHMDILTSTDMNDYKFTLVWNSEGTIDRQQTAEKLIRSGNLDTYRCFLLACTYFIEKDIVALWKKMTTANKRKLIIEDWNLSVRFWINCLREGCTGAWTEKANECLSPDHYSHGDHRIRLSCFFEKMDGYRIQYFYRYEWKNIVHQDDLRFCFNLMDLNEQVQILRRHDDMLEFHLDWPLQGVFMNTITQLSSNDCKFFFKAMVTHVLSNKIRLGWKDADYVKVLGEFWKYCYQSLVNSSEASTVFQPLMVVLHSKKYRPFTIEEIVEGFFPFDLPHPKSWFYVALSSN